MLTLEDLSGKIPEQVFDRGVVTLGRRTDNTVVLDAYSMVSGHHARLTEERGQWILEDLDSTNGTFCNGLRVRAGGRTVLKAGDVIQLGTYGPMFKVSFSAGAIPAVRIRHLSPGQRGRIDVLPGGSTTVGSGAQADIHLDVPGAMALSPVHARFVVTASRIVVEDLSGNQGVLINGRPAQTAELRHRDRIEFGQGGPMVEVEILAVPTTGATVAYLLPEREGSRHGSTSPGASYQVQTSPVHGPPREHALARDAAEPRPEQSSLVATAGGVPPDLSHASAPPASSGPVPPSPPSVEESSDRLASWQMRIPRRIGAVAESGEARADSPRRRLMIHIAVLLVLLTVTCVLGIAVSIALTRRAAGAAVLVSSAIRMLPREDLGLPAEPDLGARFRRDLDSVLVELGVERRHVGDPEIEEIWQYLDGMKARSPLRRAAPYLPEIRRVLAEHQVPAPFMYLPWVESRFDPGARSPANAIGLWQFVAHTGRRFRMRTTAGADDQRRDWVRETVAAAEYLRTLLQVDAPGWDPLLVLAAYNRGEDKILRDLEILGELEGPPPPPDGRAESRYWALRRHDILPGETREYVPRFLAAAVYFVFPEHYR